MREVLALLQLRLHQRTADTGVAVLIHPVAEPRAGDAGLGGVAPLHHAMVSVAPFLHCFHDVHLSTPVLLLVSRRRQRGINKAGRALPDCSEPCLVAAVASCHWLVSFFASFPFGLAKNARLECPLPLFWGQSHDRVMASSLR